MNENEMENISLIKGMLKRKENRSAHDHYRILDTLQTLHTAFTEKETPEQDPPA